MNPLSVNCKRVSPGGRTEVQREVAAEFSVRSVSKRLSIDLCFTNCETLLSLKKKLTKILYVYVFYLNECLCTYYMPGAH